MKPHRILFLFSAFLIGACVSSTPEKEVDAYTRGHIAFDNKDYDAALKAWKPLARQAHAGAEFYLGLMYDLGRGVPQDNGNAVMYYSNSAVHGHVLAATNLGKMYALGRGVTQNDQKAITWLEIGARRGDENARSYLREKYGY